MTQKILVTGCAGFIGMHLCRSLLNDGFEVLGIDNINNYYDPKLKHARLDQLTPYKNFTFEKINIADRKPLTKAFTYFKPNKVVNLAAQAGVRYSIENPYAYMDANLVSFLNIIELCRHNDVEGLIYASSSSVYGGNEKIPFSLEDRVDSPISLYGATKRANELIAHSYSHLYGLHTTGLRYFTVYGPWGRPDMAMFIFTKKILAGESIPVFNNGNMKRDFTYIDDCVDGILLSIENFESAKNETYNLAFGEGTTIMHLAEKVVELLGSSSQIEATDSRTGEVTHYIADVSKAKQAFGYEPKTPFEEGIRLSVEWYKANT